MLDDLSRSLVALDQDSTLIAVIELSRSSWLIGGIIPGIDREPLKKLNPDPEALRRLLHRWRDEAAAAGHAIARICVAYEAGRDGFWLARWLRARGIEYQVIHPTSVSVSREHRRAKTDRLDVGLLKRSFLGWLRGEKRHCSMAAVPTREEEDAKRPPRERERLVGDATRLVDRMKGLLALHGIVKFDVRSKTTPQRLRAVLGAEGEPLPPHTLSELVREALARHSRDRRAVARYAGASGAPGESGSKRRENGLAKAGNAQVRRFPLRLSMTCAASSPR